MAKNRRSPKLSRSARQFATGRVQSLPPAREPTISLCLITKDEEEFIGRCVKSVEGLCQQVVVVDTGSTDETVTIAEAGGAEVHFFPWNGSFADARNESLKYATGDWILILDADGELARESHEVVRGLVREYRYPVTFSGKAINYQGDGSEITEGMFRMLFPNRHGIHYTGGVHEQLAARDPETDLTNIVADIYMHHYGYLGRVIRQKKKVERNADLAEKEIAANPDDFLTRFHAGSHFTTCHEEYRAEEEFLWCLARLRAGRAPVHPPRMWFALVLAALAGVYARSERFEEAVESARESLENDPNDIQGQYWLGYSLQRLEQRAEAAQVLRRLVYESPKHPVSPLFNNRAMQGWMARREFAQNEINRGNFADAWTELEHALEESPREQSCWILLSIAACGLGDFQVGLQLFGVAASLQDPPTTLAQAYRVVRHEADGPDAVEAVIREALRLWPENPVLKQLLWDVLEARLAVAELRGATAQRRENADRQVDLLRSWSHWNEARQLVEAVEAAALSIRAVT